MTEDEARKKWCPFSRFSEGEAGGANRWSMGTDPDPKWGEPTNPVVCRCIAPDCACWVWDGLKPADAKARQGHCGLIK